MFKNGLIIFLSLLFLGCSSITPGMCAPPIPDVDVVEQKVSPGDYVTIRSYNYAIFDDDWDAENDLPAISEVFFDVNTESDDSPAFHGSYIPTPVVVEKIDGYTAKVRVPLKAVPGRIFVSYLGLTRQVLNIDYPDELDIEKECVAIGNEVTITSKKPFFNVSTFSINKVRDMLDNGYCILWVETGVKDKIYSNSKELHDDKELEWNSISKRGVPKEFYVIDKITPYSVTFRVPDFAKSGYVHIINEGGFNLFESLEATSMVSPGDEEVAYYSSSKLLNICE